MLSRRFNKLYFVILISVIFIFIGNKYEYHITNLFDYTFHRSPYTNRVFYTKIRFINPTDSKDNLYKNLIIDKNNDDRRWGTANLKRPFEEHLSINYTLAGMKNYINFIREFNSRFATRKGEVSDKVAEDLKNFIYRNRLKGKNPSEFDPDGIVKEIEDQSEKDRNPENVIYWFVNYNSACGTMSETSIALLRELGFRTRLLRMSKEKGKPLASHVFLEYYSESSKKWVMFDVLENFIPRRDGKLLSALEFFLNPKNEDNYKKTKRQYPHAIPESNIWFQINGPIKTIYILPI